MRWTPNFEEKVEGGTILFVNIFTREIGEDCHYLISEAEGLGAAHGTFPWKYSLGITTRVLTRVQINGNLMRITT